MLLRDGTVVLGEGPGCCAICNVEAGLVCTVGAAEQLLAEAARLFPTMPAVLAGEPIPGWRATEALLHTLGGDAALPEPGPVEVRLFGAAEVKALRTCPASLVAELAMAVKYGPVMAALDRGVPASFAYAGWETESLWDVSVETVFAHRGRGLAAHAVGSLIRWYRDRGKAPVWGAEISNGASLRLAAKLGFRAVDRVFVNRWWR